MTELDHTVLAIIGRGEPLSAYDIRKVFAASLTPAWSSSTGSIYPSIRRLIDAGLIEATDPEGARAKRVLSLTEEGKTTLENWLVADTAKIAVATPDPIRTRAAFLSLLNHQQRERFLAGALRNSELALTAAEAVRRDRVEAGSTSLNHLVSEGVIFQLRARIDWLKLMIEAVAAGKTNP